MRDRPDSYIDGDQPVAPEESGTVIVRIDALRAFDQVVTELGGNPRDLLDRAQIDEALLNNRNAVLSFKTMVHLLERAATELNCPHFGMRLAAAQGGAKVLGPLEVAMRNSSTLADAFRYCSQHVHAYSPATQIQLEPERETARTFLRFDIVVANLPFQQQAVEQALLLTQHAAQSISSNRARACEVWFSHEPLAPVSVYREYFNAIVRFSQPASGLFFHDDDLYRPIADPDPQLYELATSFIDTRFPSASLALSSRVRSIVGRMLATGPCTNIQVAAALGLHPRTLQRRLREEGQCFETIKDSVRRESALRYLRQPQVPLIRVAEMLGYSEASVLSRSCYRWFSSSPRQLRHRLLEAAAGGVAQSA